MRPLRASRGSHRIVWMKLHRSAVTGRRSLAGGYWQAVTGRRLGVETGFKVARHLPQEGEIQF